MREGTDDEPEIEVVSNNGSAPHRVAPAGSAPLPQPRRNPNQKRNPADDVIESGEIVERRSRVIRTNPSMQRLEVDGDPTEPVAVTPPARPQATASTPWRVLWLAAAFVAAGVALSTKYLAPPKTKPSTAGLATTADMIGSLLDSQRKDTLGRVQVIAASTQLRAGIETDAETLNDAVKGGDVMFPRDPDQVIEVVQINNSQRNLLLRLPDKAAPLTAPAVGQTALVLRNGQLGTAATAAVAPQRTNLPMTGEIATWRPLDLAPIVSRLATQSEGAAIEGFDTPVELVLNSAKPNVRIPIPTKLATPHALTLAAYVSPPKHTDLTMMRYAAGGLAIVLLGVYLAFTVRARRTA